ncbi:UDP-N-acetylglucosamine 2-epimerase [Natranaerovirga hydrolytica]|uniref:UDP-N-acetylglucosamine 2-epimerase (non-hydrolyzing) n=1 Tax=Natranaerovirga hydrolytica TaxID=680378 RepID=A0A4R1MRB9_9FIRM|nr:UDP-N-acetylglucosamine 2-epimerase (non-hydrolyzing) [Natranaerovirga hydrolytica]TCK93119.1 UDP-N-acetylglucosamine 2-epimerase [Natranaerovirga hydrolytica]
MKVMSIFGTRPEAIKMAPLVKALEEDTEIQSVVCVTAQHREMLDMVLELFHIQPDYDLNIMSHGQSIIDIISKSFYGLDDVMKKEKPDLVLVHGDTTTTCAGAQTAFLNKIPVGHVEAGLRSYNIYSPFPEEMNRKITGTIASMHFAPTQGNKNNLLKEGIKEDSIFITGNTVIDALHEVTNNEYVFKEDLLNTIDYNNKKVILLTCHRRENWGQPMENIFNGVKEIVKENEAVELIFPMHMNPKIRALANEILGKEERIHLIEPLDYEPFANLINKCHLIMTDSGGIQEEAPSLGKPVVVLRTETERPEAVEAGTVKVIGVEKSDVIQGVNQLLNNENEYLKMKHAINPYGDGTASKQIVKIIKAKMQSN